MYLIIGLFVVLLLTSLYIDWREKKDRGDISSEREYVDVAQFTYEEKLRKYKSDYDMFSPTIKTRF